MLENCGEGPVSPSGQVEYEPFLSKKANNILRSVRKSVFMRSKEVVLPLYFVLGKLHLE